MFFVSFVSRLGNLIGSVIISVMYNWELKGWPEFIYNERVVDKWVSVFSELIGTVSGFLGVLDSARQQREMMNLMISDTRDLQELVNRKIRIRKGDGRSTHYVLKTD